MNWSRSLVACLLLASSASAESKERWVYAPSNYQVDAQADRIIALMKRAKACGYTHFLITDSKFARVPTLPKRYFDNVKRVKTAAQELGIELVPALFGVGYSNDLLSNDPNLAEGLPVKEALFVVKDYIASHVPDPMVLLKDGALQNRKAWGFIDDNLISEAGALRSDATHANARFSQRLKLQPFRQYHVSVSLKTQDFRGGRAEIKVIGAKGQQLNYTYLHEKPTAEWSEKHVTFNSLEHSEVTLYFGVWGGHEGSLWWREPSIEECGLVNVLRRPGAPLEVKTEEGKLLVEGKDYEPVHDPKLGSVPYAGEYEPWHEPPNITVKDLPDGTRLRVSFHHPHIVYEGQVCACVSEPRFMSLLQRQAGDVHGLWGARSYMMSHDEWRVLGWCQACQTRHLTAGQIVADNVGSCTSMLRTQAPDARVFVWSDMFDPFHNAKPSYYLVKSDLTGSWEGLSRDAFIVNWNSDKAAESLKFFSDRGHQQLIAGYYDGPIERTRDWLRKAKPVPGVVGVMFTTWHADYGKLEAFAEMLSSEGW
ncbi:MAG: hypothetical protein JNM99_15485 [Verrucomicrobiaceae bacterium]|nr:hypothetical protein [Verrucomicrobiaceae bacterium]